MAFGHQFGETYRQECYRQLLFGVEYIYGAAVTGHVAEFGTMTGQTATVIASGLKYCHQIYGSSDRAHGIGLRRLYLFDSFQGLPSTSHDADSQSPHVAARVWAPGTCQGIDKAALQSLVGQSLPPSQIRIFDGWFADTLKTLPQDLRFAMVHIDCDLYESTVQVLDHFFNNHLFSDGAILFFDDWNCNRASPDFGERRAWAEMVEKYRPKFSDGGDYSVFGHKFIIHH